MKIRNTGRHGFYWGMAAALLCMLLPAPSLQAAAPETRFDGDVITYTSKTGVITVQGGVKLTQGDAVMTGDAGEYNTKAKEALVTGNVRLVNGDSTMTAASIRSFDDMRRLLASGNVLLLHRSVTAAGPEVEFQPEREYIGITGGARLTNPDTVLTAGAVEAFLQEDRATAQGNVRIVSSARRLEAVSDRAVYYGIRGNNAKADLIGNVRAVQDGNVLTGNHVILYLDDSAMNADGRAKLVMTPQTKPVAEGKGNPEKTKGKI